MSGVKKVSEDVFNAGETFEASRKVKIILNGEVIDEREQIDVDTLLEIAKEHGLGKFKVRDAQGNYLKRSDFPITPEKTTEITLVPIAEGGC